MSIQITTAMVDMYNSNVMHLSQQKESRLLPYVRKETQNGESEFFDRIGSKDSMKRKSGRHDDVVYSETDHSRRMVVSEYWYDADLVDSPDKMRVIMSPESEYAVTMGMSSGRKLDEIIIEALLGSAYGGKRGATAIPLPSTQVLAAFDGATATGVGLNVDTLRAVRKLFKQNEAISKGELVVFCMAAQQADDLLGQTEVTSSDFASVKALVNGEADTFLGFKFVETELLRFNAANVTYTVTTGVTGAGAGTVTAGQGRRCIAFTANRAGLFSFHKMPFTKMTELPGKHYSTQIYHAFDAGATRMEEVQVVEVLCKEV
jgi:hypothetical protein